MSSPSYSVVASPERPWLGLSSFTEATRHYFFGREREINELLDRIRNYPLTLLFGLSGRGKTSLLGAGVMPQLREHGARPVLVRLRQDASLVEQVRSAWDQATGSAASPLSLWERAYSRADMETLRAGPPVLILDQFEEVFTLGQQRPAELEALFRELACVVENRIPANLRERMGNDETYAQQFDEHPTPVRIVITLREDFLAQLETWKGLLPALMRNRMMLNPLSGPQALRAVLLPGELHSPPIVDAATAAGIVRFVAQRDEQTPLEEIEAVPPLLSLLCFELNEARLAAGLDSITVDQLEQQKTNILQNFYERCFVDEPEALRSAVESQLLVSESGHRNICAEQDLQLSLTAAGLDSAAAGSAVASLVNSRLLTQETVHGIRRIELTHDLLAPLVVRSRNGRRAAQNLATAEADRRAAQTRAEQLLRERWRWRVASVAMAIIMLVAVAAGVYAVRAQKHAGATLDIAQKSVDEVLTMLESPEMDNVHGFHNVELKLLEKLVNLERELAKLSIHETSPTDSTRRFKLDMRQANLLLSGGKAREAATIFSHVYQQIVEIPSDKVPAALREFQFECLYRLDNLRHVIDNKTYDRETLLPAGIQLFENVTGTGGNFWREAYAQQIAEYLQSQRTPDRALKFLRSAISSIPAESENPLSIDALSTLIVLVDQESKLLKAMGQSVSSAEADSFSRQLLQNAFEKHPKSRIMARHRLQHLFEELDLASSAKNEAQISKAAQEIQSIISRFSGSEALTFEAASAHLDRYLANFEVHIAARPQQGVEFARSSIAKYARLYAGQAVEINHFDSTCCIVDILDAAFSKIELSKSEQPERTKLRLANANELIELSNPFLECARTLGNLSGCHSIVTSSANWASERMQTDPEALLKMWLPRREFMLSTAQAMVARDVKQPTDVKHADRESTEPLEHYCSAERRHAEALLSTKRVEDALLVVRHAVPLCREWVARYDFDYYLRNSFAQLIVQQAKAELQNGETAAARETLKACVEADYRQCNEPYINVLENGQGGPIDQQRARELRAIKTRVISFRVQVHSKRNPEATYPAYVHIGEISSKRRFRGLEDQALWFERNRGFVLPQDVQDSFLKLENIARENNLSFLDVVAFAQKLVQEEKPKGTTEKSK
jgi:ferritin-like metal-binding protein YciE